MNTENLTNEVEQQEVTMYVTYGLDTQQAFNYSVVRGSSPEDCREKVFKTTGGRFAFMYTGEQFEGQPEDYGLTEIPLTPQSKFVSF